MTDNEHEHEEKKKMSDHASDPYFYFNIASKRNQEVLEKQLEEAKEDPLEPLSEVTKVEY